MRSSALLALVAWRLMLSDCGPMMQRRYDDMSRSLSNIELLIPLMMSDAQDASDQSDPSAAGERYQRAHLDKDMPFSNIPASAFVLDQSHPSSSHKHKRGQKHSRKLDLASLPRSVYLESDESDGSDERDARSELGELAGDMWRACSHLVRSQVRHQHELLLALCSELLDAAPAPPAPPAPAPPPSPAPSPRAPPGCPCCAGLWPDPKHARREFMPLGENSYWVQNYMKAPRRRPHRPDPNEE